MSPPGLISGPWRATRLWNDLVRTFVSGMPVRTRRQRTLLNLLHHNNPSDPPQEYFSGSDAVDWLSKSLQRNPNFGPGVSRDQVVRLLNKMLKAAVFENIRQQLNEAEFSTSEYYAFVVGATEGLRTPGKKTPTRKSLDRQEQNEESGTPRRALGELTNTPKGAVPRAKARSRSKESHRAQQEDNNDNWETKSEFSALRKSLRRVKQGATKKYNVAHNDTTLGTTLTNCSNTTLEHRQDLNRSYFQSLPPNSLIILDNDSTWRAAFTAQLGAVLSPIHVAGLEQHLRVQNVIFNMTKVSPKGVVQLGAEDTDADLPHWVLTAMKCLANWPRPMRMLDGEESPLPQYPGFVKDVFAVVRDYFVGLGSPLVPFQLYEVFQSAFIKAEAVGAKMRCFPMPSVSRLTQHNNMARMTRSTEFLDGVNQIQTSTPTVMMQQQQFYEGGASHAYPTYEAVARVSRTQMVSTPNISSNASTSIGSYGVTEDIYGRPQHRASYHEAMTSRRSSLLPPNTCFETAFMHEAPVTRIVPQKDNETLHLNDVNNRGLVYTPIPSGGSVMSWDSRSIATQTSAEEEKEKERKKNMLPKWRRSSRQRKSIAVMDVSSSSGENKEQHQHHGMANPAFQMSPGSVVDNEIESSFLRKYQRMSLAGASSTATTSSDCMIPSKALRKEKRRQRQRRAQSVEPLADHRIGFDNRGFSPNSSGSSNSEIRRLHQQYTMSTYNELTVKTPIAAADVLPSQGMQLLRAEPYRNESSEDLMRLSQEGMNCAVDAFKLLGLLLPPGDRRKLQLLLKFMKRVSVNPELSLNPNNSTNSSNESILLETFADTILRPRDMASYDGELSRKMVRFFYAHYEAVWTPPEALRRDVEEQVYQSLVSQRLEAGEDPYPITYCQRVAPQVYETEKTSAVQSALSDLLEHILTSGKLGLKEKRKKLAKFKEAYPMIYRQKFPSVEAEPEWIRGGAKENKEQKFSSLSRLKNAIRI